MHEDHRVVQVHASGRNGTGRRAAPWLIAGVTGRALAQSAARRGHRVVVLDYFADRDCAEHASECRSVCASGGLRFDRSALLGLAEELAPADRSNGLIYGSGFEGRVGLLQQLSHGRELFGNRPETVRLVGNPDRFFPLLDRLGIRHPETRMKPPARAAGWLAKQAGGAGGVHVRLAAQAAPGARTYYQRFEAGRTLSLTFLANGNRGAILGYNQQWTHSARPELAYQFGGAVGGLWLPRRVSAEIAEALDRLVGATGLVGLNGLDFILSGNRWSVLEVNPRPTATMELYDPDYRHGLFDWHLRACKGELPEKIPRMRAARALSIVSAAEAWESFEDFTFPKWCRDLPRIGLEFAAGDPVCSVHAAAATPEAAVTLIRRRHARVEKLLAESAGVPCL